MPKREPLDWEDLEQDLHAAGVNPEEIQVGARRLLAQARGHVEAHGGRLDLVAAELNHRPRQTLKWKTPCQAMDEALR